MIHARTSLCADAETLASADIRVQPWEGKGQSSIVAIELGGITILSHAMEAEEFLAHWLSIAANVAAAVDQWQQTGWVDLALDAEQRADAGLDQPRGAA